MGSLIILSLHNTVPNLTIPYRARTDKLSLCDILTVLWLLHKRIQSTESRFENFHTLI